MSHHPDPIKYAVEPQGQGVVLIIWSSSAYELRYCLPSSCAAWQRLNHHLASAGQSRISYADFQATVEQSPSPVVPSFAYAI
ncbi:hypothetical protein [Prochlorothrix hollandica]|uniref:Uncharacterized protein n=1 Tax=Prochlorothrix hollandica PCC 9006 = CALU 1027 TaxID=317619 RepID=A0A0M2Q069_PROHO|nr:hypothetical protein [Prochlorothrix hollandica]KKJ00708.1 hypothetical protein PROH_05330 [Prochlorothrix hollandica PCC 9006 = CALU 1027]